MTAMGWAETVQGWISRVSERRPSSAERRLLRTNQNLVEVNQRLALLLTEERDARVRLEERLVEAIRGHQADLRRMVDSQNAAMGRPSTFHPGSSSLEMQIHTGQEVADLASVQVAAATSKCAEDLHAYYASLESGDGEGE